MNAGDKLGPYEIAEPLGKGGMGEVWLAEDTRLGRKVAVKILPAEFAGDPERLARFEQEARASAALNHPHIAAVFDVGHDGDTHFMVQEYLQGKTLRDALDSGPIPVEKGLALAVEIAEALRAAHAAGIVHRDLKPENVFVTGDGHAKVLDFGLAKLTEVAAGPLNSQSMSPTVLGTQVGSVLGTAGYMAPEQVQGEDVDQRADLFAFGCVLYELVTGTRAFAGKSVPHTLHRILDEEPEDFESAAGSLPLRLRWALEKCLAKDPAQRTQSAADIIVDLQRTARELESGTAIEGTGVAKAGAEASGGAGGLSLRTVVPAAALLLLAGAALASFFGPRAEPAPGLGPVRFVIDLPPGRVDFGNRNQQVIDVSPDGRMVVMVADEGLWLRQMNDLEPVLLRGTDEPRAPSFSPDSTQIAFWKDDQIHRIEVTGGTPVIVGSSPGRPQGLRWARDGFIYVGLTDGKGIQRLPDTGGEGEIVVQVTAEQERVYGPQLLPDGEWLLFTLATGPSWDEASIAAQSLVSGDREIVLRGGHDARLSPTGHLLYVTGSVLMARRFDPGARAVSGGAVPLLENVRTSAGRVSGAAYYAVSQTGSLAYVGGAASRGVAQFGFLSHTGELEVLPAAPAPFGDTYSISPDGGMVATELNEGSTVHVWVYGVDRPTGQRLSTSAMNGAPVWSADSEWVYFAKSDGDVDLWRRRADLSAPEERVLAAEGEQIPTAVSNDGAWLYYESDGDLWRMPIDAEGEPEALVATPAMELQGRPSPDGRYLLFASDEAGLNAGVYVLDLESGRRWSIALESGGWLADWSQVANEIYYTSDQGLLRVVYEFEPEFAPALAELVRPHPANLRFASIRLHPDGQRTLMSFDASATDLGVTVPRVDVVLNWFEELLERAPLDR